jgi:hypothetical protein
MFTQLITRAAGMVLLCACVLLVGIYPHHPRGVLGWSLFLLLAAPVTVGIETMGLSTLQSRFVHRLGRAGRLVCGVGVILALAALLLPVWQWVKPYMDTW